MCVMCGRDTQLDVVLTDARKSVKYCPNHICAALVDGKLKFVPNMKAKDELRGQFGAVKYSQAYGGEEYVLSPETMRRLINRSLYKAEWRGLVKNQIRKGKATGYGDLPYLLHDDFYNEDGSFWQEIMPNPQLTRMYQR